MDVIVVCHTEYGYVDGETLVFDQTAREGVAEGVRQLATLAGRHGAKVTFALAPETACDFPEDTGQEIGLHVHPGCERLGNGRHSFCVGDRYLREHCAQSSASTALKDYPCEEQRAMIVAGRDHIRETLGVRPRVFVAGRWSVNDDTIRALAAEGFTHDCSAVPHKRPAHYDWSRLPRICMPYRPDRDDYQRKGDLPLLIVPVSQSLLGASATPELAPLVGLPWLKACFEEYYRQQLPLFHLCLHSPAMISPYYRAVMDGLLGHMTKRGVTFRFASEVREYPAVHPSADIRPYLAGINRGMLRAAPALARKALRTVRPVAGN